MIRANFIDTAHARGFGLTGHCVAEFMRIEDSKMLCVMASSGGVNDIIGSISEPNDSSIQQRVRCRAAVAMIMEYAQMGVHHVAAVRAAIECFGASVNFTIASISDGGEYLVVRYEVASVRDVSSAGISTFIVDNEGIEVVDGADLEVDAERKTAVRVERGVLGVGSVIILSAAAAVDREVVSSACKRLNVLAGEEDFMIHRGLRSAVGAIPESEVQGDELFFAALHFCKARKLLFCTGPPFNELNDEKLCGAVRDWDGGVVIAGGTTAQIVSRGLDREITVNLRRDVSGLPPTSSMHGVELVTEGVLTLAKLSALLERVSGPELSGQGIDYDVARILINSHDITFIVGTRINVVHQDPQLPMELELRRNVVKRIGKILETKFLRRVTITYL